MPRNQIHEIDHAPLRAQPCACDEPVGDPREMTCVRCGRQIAGVPLPPVQHSVFALGDHSIAARKARRYGPAL